MKISEYIESKTLDPLFLCGDSINILKEIPRNNIDVVITSPPYWNKREYENGGIGLEKEYSDYIDDLLAIILEIKRILKPTGSFWLNIGDSYKNKSLLGIPWRVALKMIDEQKWILRNEAFIKRKIKYRFKRHCRMFRTKC